MARTANSENVRRDVEGPDYQRAVDLIRGPIRTNQSDASSIGQENSTLFKRIEKSMGVHRGAATDFAKIDKMAPEKRDDYLRSLKGMLKVAKFGDFDDLVDRAEKAPDKKPDGEAFDYKAAAKKKPAKPAKGAEKVATPPEDGSDLAEAGGADGSQPTGVESAIEKARAHLRVVPAPDALNG